MELRMGELQKQQYQQYQQQPLNVVVPSNGQTSGFAERLATQEENQNSKDLNTGKRPKTAQSKAKSSNTRRGRGHRLKAGEKTDVFNASMVVMNQKKLNVAAGSTVKGIVSLYNKGFVPKKTGKVSKKSMFAIGNNKNTFYDVGGDKNDYDYAPVATENNDLYVGMDSQEFPRGNSAQRDPTLGASSSGKIKIQDRSEERQPFGNQVIQRISNPAESRQPHAGQGLVSTEVFGSGIYINDNVRLSNSQNYMHKESDEENMTALQTQDKQSFQASEVVLQSVEAVSGEGIIDYSNKDRKQAADQQIKKGQFKLPSTKDVMQNPIITPKKSLGSADFGSAVARALSNEEHESRELTEAEENVMRPINLLEKANSFDQQPKAGPEMVLLIANDDAVQSSITPNKQSGLNDKFQSTVQLVRSSNQKAAHTKFSQSMTDGHRSADRQNYETSKTKPKSTGQAVAKDRLNSKDKTERLHSKESAKIMVLNNDLTLQQSHELKSREHRLKNNPSQSATDRIQHLQKTHSSIQLHKARSPAETSLSLFAGKSLQSRPLIGSQLIRKLAVQAIQNQAQSIPNERNTFSRSQQSGNRKKNMQIHLEISAANLLNKGLEQVHKVGTYPLQNQNTEKALHAEASPRFSNQKKIKPTGSHHQLISNTQESNRLHSIEHVHSPQMTASLVRSRQSKQQNIRSNIVLVSGQLLQHTPTLEQLASVTKVQSGDQLEIKQDGTSAIVPITNSQVASNKTHRTDAFGKVHHVLVLNQTSGGGDLLKSSNEKIAVASKRSQEKSHVGKRRRRKKRPSSSRLSKPKGKFRFDLMNEKASNGEDIATVKGGSTSRNNQLSHREISPKRRSPGRRSPGRRSPGRRSPGRRGSNQDMRDTTHPFSLENLRKQAQEFATDSHRSAEKMLRPTRTEGNQDNIRIERHEYIRHNHEPRSQSFLLEDAEAQTPLVDKKQLAIQKMQTLQVQATGAKTAEQGLLVQAPDKQDPQTVHNSINDYLKEEEISGVQILDVGKSALLTSNNITARDALGELQQPKVPPIAASQVTIYQEGEEGQVTGPRGTSNPTNSNAMPINAMYSHMSILRGTMSIETNSRAENLTDHKHEVATQQPKDFTTRLISPAGDGMEEKILYLSNHETSTKENQMMVVTKIRSKMSKDHDSAEGVLRDDSKVTMDCNEQVDIQLASARTGFADSQGDEFQIKEQQEQLQPQLMTSQMQIAQSSAQQVPSSTHNISQVSQAAFLQQLTSQYSPVNNDDTLNNRDYLPPPPLPQPQNETDAFTFSLLLTAQAQAQTHFEAQEMQTQTLMPEAIYQAEEEKAPTDGFDLSMTIKRNQEMAKLGQIQGPMYQPTQKNLRSDQMKQHDLLARKEQSVVSSGMATVPEKTLYQRRFIQSGGDPGLCIVGQQTYTLTRQQFNTFLKDNEGFFNSLQQHTQTGIENEQQFSQPASVQHQIGPVFMTGPGGLSPNASVSQDKTESPGPLLVDKGLQNTHREDLTSLSNASRSGAPPFFGLDHSRRTVQTAGFHNNITSQDTQHNEMALAHFQQEYTTGELDSARQKQALTAFSYNQTAVPVGPGSSPLRYDTRHCPTSNATRNEFMITPVHHVQPAEQVVPNQEMFIRPPALNGALRSPLHSTDDGTEQSMSPYVMMKNRLMLTSSHQGSQAKVQQATQVDFSARMSERYHASWEQYSNPGANSAKQILPNQDLADVNSQQQHLETQQAALLTTSPFLMQKNFMASAEERTLEQELHAQDVGEEPGIKTAGAGAETASQHKDEDARTALLEAQPAGDLNINQDDLRYSSASNISDQNLRSAQQLQSAIPANFDVKIVKVQSQAAPPQGARRRGTAGGEYQGAPPNYFMRKGSDLSSSPNALTSQNALESQPVTPLEQYYDKKQEETRHKVNKSLFRQDAGQSGTISLAVEARDLRTGARKKIVRSTAQRYDGDQQSDQTQTEAGAAGAKDPQALTLDANEYSSAYKVPSDTSYRILGPRLGGYDTTGHNSIQVTVGRATKLSEKPNASPARAISPFTEAQKEEAERKVKQSKSRVFEELGNSLYNVSQKRIQQLGVAGQASIQQTFNKIRDSIQRENQIKRRQELAEQTELKKQKDKAEQSQTRALKKLSQNASQLLPVDLKGGVLEAILEDTKADKKARKHQARQSALTRDGVRASQNLIEFANLSQRREQQESHGLLANPSGIFDPQSDVLRHTRMRAIHREEPDYSKKTAVQHLIAKRQRCSQMVHNMPLPMLSTPGMGISMAEIGTRECFSAKESAATRSATSNLRYGAAGDQVNVIGGMQQTNMSGFSDLEQQMEQADLQGRQLGLAPLRPGSYSAQVPQPPQPKANAARTQKSLALPKSGQRATKPNRPISSGAHVPNKRSSQLGPMITPQVRTKGTKGSLPPSKAASRTAGSTSNNTVVRPLTAQIGRDANSGAKSRPSLAKGSSTYYTSGGAQLLASGSDTQASSAVMGVQRPAHQRLFSAATGEQKLRPRIHHQHQAQGDTATRAFLSRNVANEYATTYQHGGGSITGSYHAPDQRSSASGRSGPQNLLLMRGQRARPFSGVYRGNTDKNYLVNSGRQPAQLPQPQSQIIHQQV